MTKRMSMFQRAVLVIMAQENLRIPAHTSVRFSRRALEFALWFDWQSHHSEKMTMLIEQGWINQITLTNGVIVYELTDAARGSLGDNLTLMGDHCSFEHASVPMWSAGPDDPPF